MSQERSIDLFLGLETGKSDQLDCAIDHEGDKVPTRCCHNSNPTNKTVQRPSASTAQS